MYFEEISQGAITTCRLPVPALLLFLPACRNIKFNFITDEHWQWLAMLLFSNFISNRKCSTNQFANTCTCTSHHLKFGKIIVYKS